MSDLFYIVHKGTREVVRQSPKPFNSDESVQPHPPLIQLKRVEDETVPVYDESREKLVQNFVDDDNAGTRTFIWEVAPLSQEEINAYAKRQTDAETLEQLRAVYQDLKNGAGTSSVRIARLEKICAYLLRHEAESAGLKDFK